MCTVKEIKQQPIKKVRKNGINTSNPIKNWDILPLSESDLATILFSAFGSITKQCQGIGNYSEAEKFFSLRSSFQLGIIWRGTRKYEVCFENGSKLWIVRVATADCMPEIDVTRFRINLATISVTPILFIGK